MLGLSTSFLSTLNLSDEEIISSLSEFKISGLELDYRITQKQYARLFPYIKTSDLSVISVHNYFPHPTVYAHLRPGGDLFHLCHLDPEHRQNAVQWTLKTIEHAHDLEASVVVIHCGQIDCNANLDRLHHFYLTGQIESDQAQSFISRQITARQQLHQKHLDALMFSLDKLAQAASKYSLKIGLENRRHFHEMPNFEELSYIFYKFEGSPLAYWHDIGHAYVNEQLTLLRSDDLIRTFAKNLAGVHLHDARQLEDHLLPGKGEIKFENYLELIPPDIACILELKPGTPTAEIEQSILLLQQQGYSQ